MKLYKQKIKSLGFYILKNNHPYNEGWHTFIYKSYNINGYRLSRKHKIYDL